ncbi:MAG: radical SAM protein, partial [Lachnospiraceae bacterium]|nr:radical SAM protein [Lachnospiraceae bacterium]
MDYELLLLSLSRNVNSQAAYFQECLGQHMIAAYLAKHDFRAKVYSGDILNGESFILQEVKEHQIQYAGFYVAADNVTMIGNLIKRLKEITNLILFVGGPQAAALGEEFLKRTSCDFIIVGEGERPVLQLLSYLEDRIGNLEEVKSLRYLNAEGIFSSTPLDEPIMDLDTLPYPRRMDSFHKKFRMTSSIGLLTGRGCPFHCTFCYEGATSKIVRYRSIKNVMGEIDEVLEYNPSLTTVNIFDDTFTLQPERVYEFCREMKRRKLHWTCEAHVSCICKYPEMLKVMIDSGLVAMQIGIESGSQRVLEAYQKHITPEMIVEVVRYCYQEGLCTLEGNYIIGGAFESDKTLLESLNHAKCLLEEGRGMMEVQTVFFAPYFDTPITKNPEKFGMRILPERIENIIT